MARGKLFFAFVFVYSIDFLDIYKKDINAMLLLIYYYYINILIYYYYINIYNTNNLGKLCFPLNNLDPWKDYICDVTFIS